MNGSLKLFRLGVFSLSILFSLLILETAGRIRYKAWPFSETLLPLEDRNLSEQNASLRWLPSSGEGRNTLGLRGEDLPSKKTGEFRILLLGDSLVDWGETCDEILYSEVVERALNAGLPGTSHRIRVVNAGIPGYTTYQELEFLEKHGLDMQPDVVVLGFVFNDLFYKYLHLPTKLGDTGLDPTIYRNAFDGDSFPGSLVSQSYAAHWLYVAIDKAAARVLGRARYPFEEKVDLSLAWKEYPWTRARMLLVEMRNRLEELDIAFLALIFPVVYQVDDDYRRLDEDYVLFPRNKIQNIFSDLGVPFLDLTEVLYRSGGPSLFSDHVHLTRGGNDLVGQHLLRFLVENVASLRGVEVSENELPRSCDPRPADG